MILAFDFETCSAASIKDGAAAYAQHPSTRVWCGVFALTTGRGKVSNVTRWRPGQPVPAFVNEHVLAGRPMLAHNASFEDSIIRFLLSHTVGFAKPSPDQWIDTAALASCFNLPFSLAGLAEAIGAEQQKDMEGNDLMKSFANVTVKDGKFVYPTPTPAEIDRIELYCERDVLTMIECLWRLPRPHPFEVATMRVDRRINHRGMRLDQEFAEQLVRAAKARGDAITEEVFAATNDLFGLPSPPALIDWLAAQGVEAPRIVRKRADKTRVTSPSVGRAAIAELLKRDLPKQVRAVLEYRLEAGRLTSLAKAAKVPSLVNADGRLRHALRYCGAHTGRWSSKGFQAHNLARPSKEFLKVRSAFLAQIVRGDIAGASLFWSVLEGMSFLLRSLVIAADGHELVGADYSAIEARVLAWVAGQTDVLEQFVNGDVYVEDAARQGSTNRQFGKLLRLGLGYGMGALRFRETAADNGIALEPKAARKAVDQWRKANPRIVEWWGDLEDAFRSAILNPGVPFTAGDFVYVIASKDCAKIVLPSGRALHYWRPYVKRVVKKIEVIDADGDVTEREFETDEVRFYAADAKGMKVESTYSGKLAENVVQAISRDLMADALHRLEDTIYKPIVHVHDAITAEVKIGEGSVDEFCAIMSAVPAWAPGLPIAVEGYRSRHFKG